MASAIRHPMASRVASVMASGEQSAMASRMAWAWKSQLPYPLVPLFPIPFVTTESLNPSIATLLRAGARAWMAADAAEIGGGSCR